MKSATNSCIFYDSKEVSSMGKTSCPNTTRTISSRGYEFCGEPLVAQHLILDFTPIDGVDSDSTAKKVCSFWDFIHATPDIQHLKTMPEEEHVTPMTKKSTCANLTATIGPDSGSEDHHDKTAIEVLQYANAKGMLAGTQFPKSNSRYTIGSRDYNLDDYDKERERKRPICTCTKTVKSTYCANASKGTSGLPKIVKEWDAKHPKTMEPPGHSPALQHCIMQRPIRPPKCKCHLDN